MKVGSRIFSPRPFTTLLTLVVLAGLLALGRWQLQRADQKRALFDAFGQGTDTTLAIDVATPAVPRYQHIEARGRYDDSRQILIDNMAIAGGGAGYFVITPFSLAGGGWLLVNRGWVPVGESRTRLPVIPVSGAARTVRGRADHLPSPGIRMGHPAELRPPYPAVANFPTHQDIERLLRVGPWTGATELMLLDAGEPEGYLRQWQAPGFPPLRHVAYAVQWFGLAAALAVIYVATNLRRAA